MEQVSIKGLGQVAVPVKDLDRAAAFYRDTLGLPFLFSAPGMAFLQCGTVRLMLSLPEKEEFRHPSSVLYFQVADIRAAHQALKDKAVHFEAPPHVVARLPQGELWMAFFRDSENNLLALMSQGMAPEGH